MLFVDEKETNPNTQKLNKAEFIYFGKKKKKRVK